MKKRLFPVVALGLMLCGSPVLQSCAPQRTTQTTVSSDPNALAAATTTTTTATEEPDSVVGATLHAVATVILFPFRLVGDALSLLV